LPFLAVAAPINKGSSDQIVVILKAQVNNQTTAAPKPTYGIVYVVPPVILGKMKLQVLSDG
jgi:hypothetical protein